MGSWYRGSGVRTGGRPWRCVAACSSFARSLNALRSPQLKIHSFGHTSLSSSVPSPVRRWWLSPISQSSCPASVFASHYSLASFAVTSTSLIKDGSWWMKTKIWRECCRDALICMRSGLKGGGKPPVVPGSWHCRRVLTVAKHVFLVSCSSRVLGTSPKLRHQRETQALGRAPQRSPAVEPTQRRASTSGPGVAAPRVVPPRVPAGGMLRRFLRRFVVLGSRRICWCRWRKACSLRRSRRFLRGKSRWLI